jgi:peptide/nickel transport system substrate-binding protein
MAAPGNEPIDLVDALNSGRISRRDFVRRGALLGLSIPTIAAVLAACGDDDDDAETGEATGDTGADTATATATGDTGADTATADTGTATAPAGTGSIRIATQKPAGPLDPIGMQDLGSYGIVAQCFEFLCGLGEEGDIGPGLAESWEPNADGTVWTFNLRQGVKWEDGTDFTSADVAATFDRLSAAANAGLNGVIGEGSVDASDPAVAVVTLLAPNGNFPYLVSVYNAQAVITPVAFTTGTTLDGAPNGTGPWKLVSFDAATGATYEAKADYWGGAPALSTAVWSFFDDEGAMVTAAAAGEVDTLVQFQVVGGEALFDNPDFNVVGFPAATHRQIWMRCDTGQFADKRVRQALGMSIDRQALIDTLFKGEAQLGNDHVIAPIYPYFDDSVPQRERDVEGAKALLAEAGFPDGLTADLHFGQLQEIPELAQLIQAQAAEGGFTLNLAGESLDTFYGAQWCPAEPADPPCSGAAELGIVDYGHRATPDVYLNAALSTGGIWNSSQYSSPEFDAAFAAYQSAIGVEAQKVAAKTIEEILLEDTPVVLPYWYNYITGWSTKFDGIRVSALGQMFLEKATQVA